MTMVDRLSRRVGRFPIEVPAALLAAAAVGYLLLLGLELGRVERFASAAVGAMLSFLAAWAGLRALEPRRAAEAGMPKFRKADLHPDAPLRRPIRAGEEFGIPELQAPDEVLPPPLAAVPLPSFLQPVGASRDEPVRYVDETVRDVPDGVVSLHAPVWFRPAQAEDEAEYADWEDAPDVEPEPESQPEPEFEPAPRLEPAAVPVNPVADIAAPEAPANESVAELMARLEAGLARRAVAGRPLVPDDETRAALRAVAADLRAIATDPGRADAATGRADAA